MPGLLPALPPVIGHRGAAAAAPENTLAGFRRAAALGCRWVELDVRLTADDVLVVFHDDTLSRTTDGTGFVAETRLAELRRLDAGAWFGASHAGERIPILAETIALLAALGLGANIEIKPDAPRAARTGAETASMLRTLWPEALPPPLLSSFSQPALAAARDTAPEIARGLLVGDLPPDWRQRAETLDCVSIHAAFAALSPMIVAQMRAARYGVLAYTVNDPAVARSLWELGVTSVFSDSADLDLRSDRRQPCDTGACDNGPSSPGGPTADSRQPTPRLPNRGGFAPQGAMR